MTTPLSQDDKPREQRARRAAARQGLRLTRSRTRNERAYDFGQYFLSDSHNWLQSSEYGMNLDEVEEYLAAE
ncbi:hypothetical protein FDO65_07050 [Nakamurella flava]|uniref:Uncharacterized protein n=1 Tax=Nakamurella flava TaxID=2576308 RepID=A0A4U6QMG8_9ACTN|nr:hypothetical protein [Nakamurella flava]TKV61348.1 hypothetical protein FDO65_07050 [Nakamurella flava]